MLTSAHSNPQDKRVREVLKHVSALDGVRGVAILMVLLHHLLWSNSTTSSHFMQTMIYIKSAGWVGVDLFFALSGFLITGILFDSLQDTHYFRNFYLRRVLRIFPLYYGVIFILFLAFHASSAAEKRPLYLLLAYLQNTPLWWKDAHKTFLVDPVSHLWSLAVEEQFYFVWPVIIFWIRDRKRLLWISLTLALTALILRTYLLAHGAAFEETYKMTICRADSLLGGAWLALVIRGDLRERILKWAPFAFWITVAACGVIAWKTGNFDWEINRPINMYGYSLLAIASVSVIAMALRPASIASHLFNAGPLRFFGKYSYGIYVYHQLFAALADQGLTRMLSAHIHSKALFHITSAMFTGTATVLISMLSFNFFEKPFLNLKKYFNYSSH